MGGIHDSTEYEGSGTRKSKAAAVREQRPGMLPGEIVSLRQVLLLLLLLLLLLRLRPRLLLLQLPLLLLLLLPLLLEDHDHYLYFNCFSCT